MKRVLSAVRGFIRDTDKLLFFLCLAASAFGLLTVMSATRYRLSEGQRFSRDFSVMLLAVLLGVILALVISAMDYQVFSKLWLVIAAFCVLIMLTLFKFGTSPSYRTDARTWLPFGPVLFQPSELVKIGFILTFGVHLGKLRDKLNRLSSIAQLGVHALTPVILVVTTGDMGSALVFVIIAAVMLFVSGLHWGYFFGGIALFSACAPLVWTFILKPLQKNRLLALIYPELYPDIVYQPKLGLSAISRGGLTGQGLFKGTYTQAGTVPLSMNDMIFSAIGEELGLIGCLAALGLLTAIALRMIHVGKSSGELSANLICSGVAAMVVGQMIINVGMCLMLLPVIGITLPFFSAGGSSNLCVYLGVGLVLSIYRHGREKEAVSIRI